MSAPGRVITPGEGWDTDEESVVWHLARETHALPLVARFTILGEPASKSRARFTNRGGKVRTYTPEKTKQAEERVAWAFRQAAGPHAIDGEATFGVFAVFFAGTRQRRDVDNMLKLILDGLNGVAWQDDSQVEEVSGRRGIDRRENARTEVLIYRVGSKSEMTATCEQCGQDYRTYPSWRARRFCTDACHLRWRADRRLIECPTCGSRFERTKEGQRFCSQECHYESKRVTLTCTHCGLEFIRASGLVKKRNYCTTECATKAQIARRKGVAKGTCIDCGGGVSRKEYQRCIACHRAGKSDGAA